MLLKENNPENKLSGTYYTPDDLAEAIVDKLPDSDYSNILEPSCGMGIFIDALIRKYSSSQYTAIDNDSEAVAITRERYAKRNNVCISCSDFFDFYKKAKGSRSYDLIVGNPPYIRYQYLSDRQRQIMSEILSANGMKSNRLINAWVAFLVACVDLLSDNGLIAFVIPAELLQVAYAEDLRRFLIDMLDDITIITFRDLVFSDVQQETIVFYGYRGNGNNRIRIIETTNALDFRNIDLNEYKYQTISDKKDKWTKYFAGDSDTGLFDDVRGDKRFKYFKDVALINVGITTGNNKYFSITKQTETKYDLSSATLPLIGRSSQVHGIHFTTDDWKRNRDEGRRAMLLDFPDIPYSEYPDGYKRYISLGESNGENTGYKCRIRERWYIVPSIWIPDAFFLRRNYLYPKLVLNDCDAVSTDTMHRIKFNADIDRNDILLAYYNSITFAFTEICGRSYGGGVLEILPGELGKVMIPDISKIDNTIKQHLLAYVDKIVRSEDDIEKALDAVDHRLLIDKLGIPEKWCTEARRIWKTMQQRRLARSI